jgi:excisionase family DNA binding protein
MPANASRAALSVDEFCTVVGISRTLFYGEVKVGRISILKAGRRTLVRADEVDAWLERLGRAQAVRDGQAEPIRGGSNGPHRVPTGSPDLRADYGKAVRLRVRRPLR